MEKLQTVIQQMIDRYHSQNIEDKRNAIKEVIQEIVLCGLSKSHFFDEAAFYGGTALRIFYGLDRFSEDLDFSLLIKNSDFDFVSFFSLLKSTVNSFGLNVDIQIKSKTKESSIQSAFLKGDTIEQFLLFYPESDIQGINKNEKIKIKIEIDTNPPAFATYETRFNLLPVPYSVRLYDESSLFAGKIHAVICRGWQSRIKGRDLYDYVFFLSHKTKLNLPHLKERLVESGYISRQDECSLEDVKKMLNQRFSEIDFDQAKLDVIPFIKDISTIDIWSQEFFTSITTELTVNNE